MISARSCSNRSRNISTKRRRIKSHCHHSNDCCFLPKTGKSRGCNLTTTWSAQRKLLFHKACRFRAPRRFTVHWRFSKNAELKLHKLQRYRVVAENLTTKPVCDVPITFSLNNLDEYRVTFLVNVTLLLCSLAWTLFKRSACSTRKWTWLLLKTSDFEHLRSLFLPCTEGDDVVGTSNRNSE